MPPPGGLQAGAQPEPAPLAAGQFLRPAARLPASRHVRLRVPRRVYPPAVPLELQGWLEIRLCLFEAQRVVNKPFLTYSFGILVSGCPTTQDLTRPSHEKG